jgi:DUF971 family protein
MENLRIISINRLNKFLLEAEWNDGSKSTVKLASLRNNCPCADCDEKRKKKAESKMPELRTVRFGEFEIKSLDPAGNLGLSVEWMDGHKWGVYTWNVLRDVFTNNALSEEEKNKLLNY